jgi:hypothetical protein
VLLNIFAVTVHKISHHGTRVFLDCLGLGQRHYALKDQYYVPVYEAWHSKNLYPSINTFNTATVSSSTAVVTEYKIKL